MSFAYGDIIALNRPEHRNDAFSRRHPPMAALNRAKIFAPFAALAGFDEAVRAKEVPYVPRRALDDDERRALNRHLNRLYAAAGTMARARRSRVVVRVEYFAVCTDRHSEAFGRMGLYHTAVGRVDRVDPCRRTLTVDGREIAFSDIRAIHIPAPMGEGRIIK